VTVARVSTTPPESGQLVRVRDRHWVVVSAVPSSGRPAGAAFELRSDYLVSLSSVDDDGLSDELQVFWSLEGDAVVLDRATLPRPEPDRFDDPERLKAFLDAVRWGAIASADGKALQAPFRSGITIEDYQLDPVVRALDMPRVNLVLGGDRSAFDLIVGNPPFLGGKFISGKFGTDYRTFLVRCVASGRRGHADLVAYFFLRGASVGDRFGFIATNTIGQGDTREVGLDALLESGWTIVPAEKSRAWPGTAAIQVAQVWCRFGRSAEPSMLSGSLVPGISALLVPVSRASGTPFRLFANLSLAFQGSILLGMGFIVSPEQAAFLTAQNKQNCDVLFPYIGAEDVCDQADSTPMRYVINFANRSEAEAARYVECFDRIAARVKPGRAKSSHAVSSYPWWLHWRPRPELYRSISDLKSVIVMPLHSKYSIPLFRPSGSVYSHGLAVFATESYEMYGVISSGIHRAWSKSHGSTLETRARYTPTDCFETFPLPERATEAIGSIIRDLHDHRAAIMLTEDQGLTATYNRLHSPGETSAAITRLRIQHQTLDAAVMAAYGWSDIDLDYNFRVTDDGLRFTLSETARIEILDRLLELNHERHAHEVATGVGGNGKRVASKPRGRNSAKEPSLPLPGVD
jgi:hypothetical protein